MHTTLTKRGQTVVPASIRNRYDLREGDRLVWLDDGLTIRVVPVPSDPIQALRGSGSGQGLMAKLLQERKQDRDRER